MSCKRKSFLTYQTHNGNDSFPNYANASSEKRIEEKNTLFSDEKNVTLQIVHMTKNEKS